MEHDKNLFSLNATVIPFFISLLLIAIVAGPQEVSAQEMEIKGKVSVPGQDMSGSDPVSQGSDDLCSINAVKRYISSHINYPESAIEAGHAGTVELYARINNQGGVNEVLELQPVNDYIELEEIEIVEYAPAGQEIYNSSRHEKLLAESHRVITSLPQLDIPEIYGHTLQFTFKFVLK
ncbi:MAG: hypothetical protein R6U11_07075 [Bacteroidales bacterium]